MRPPEAQQSGAGEPAALSDSRALLSRINASLSADQLGAQGSSSQGREGRGSLSPATGANALPASPPLGQRAVLLPPSRRYSASTSPRGTGPEASSLDIMRLAFESPSESAARLKAAPTTSTAQPLIDEPLFQEHERSFAVPKYLDHSVWRSRMFTYPSPTRSQTASKAPLPAPSSAYSTLLNSSPGRPAREKVQPVQRKSQLAASLTSARAAATGEDWTIPLPTCWDQEDRCPLVEVTGDGLEVSFCGSGKNGDRDAAAVRANRHMPSYTGIYYYEVEIVSKGQSGYIAIGFSGLNVSLSRLPGWEANSWGYHGDDGHSFASQGTGRQYGPMFSTGDVVGCGIDFTQQRAFFTKNGAFLGFVFDKLEGQLYPSVGMKTPGEVVRANFGQVPFRFDIESFVLSRKQKLLKSIDQTSVPDSYLLKPTDDDIPPEPVVPEAEAGTLTQPNVNLALDRTIASLVSAYLTFHGFVDTAHAFEAQRAADRRRYTNAAESNVADETEMVEDSEMADLSATQPMDRRQQICRAVSMGRPEVALELLAEHWPIETAAGSGPLADITFRLRCQHFVELILASSSASASTKGKGRAVSSPPPDLDAALEYGRELQAQYGGDERPSVKQALSLTFALWAYDDPKNATEDEIRWLASQAARDKLADELNAAVLDAEGHSARPVLESVLKHAVVTAQELGRAGDGAAAFVDVASELFRVDSL